MQPETQGQSHQISNISFGPDGKLYVHNGDGFDSSKGQDLTSFRGKILRMNLGWHGATDNPFYNRPTALLQPITCMRTVCAILLAVRGGRRTANITRSKMGRASTACPSSLPDVTTCTTALMRR